MNPIKVIAAVTVAIMAVLACFVLFPHFTFLLVVLAVLLGVPAALIRRHRRRGQDRNPPARGGSTRQ